MLAKSFSRKWWVMVKRSAGEKKRDLIVSVCKKLFYEKGYNNTTYNDICTAADIPPGTITYHFENKRGIASVIEDEYEPQNKIYIERMCTNRGYSKVLLMAIENFHMWKRDLEDPNLRNFLIDVSRERVPSKAAFRAVKYFYQCVIDELGITVSDKEMRLIVPTQIGMSDAVLMEISRDPDSFTYEEAARFSIRFFLRQLGVADSESEHVIAEAREIFKTLPIDNRYYREFAYDPKYLTVLD